MAPEKIIIDTDPGVDDILALLLALSASAEEIELLLVSLTFGNIDVENCLRNAVSLFHVLEKELAWREANGKPIGYESLRKYKPILAVGAEQPLDEQLLMADYFHGIDGLGGVHSKAPNFTPENVFRHLFHSPSASSAEIPPDAPTPLPNECLFTPSAAPAYLEILSQLKSNPPNTVTIVAIGPLTNLALAAAHDPETFLRVKEVVIMSGTIDMEGNVTPTAEFNSYADAVATARVFALTSPSPRSTVPPCKSLKAYPETLPSKLNLTIFPLDLTTMHLLNEAEFNSLTGPLKEQGSPLAQWSNVFIHATFRKMESLYAAAAGESVKRIQDVDISLHDPLCVWYMITKHLDGWKAVDDRDIRVDATGQWTRGMYVVDRRTRRKPTIEEMAGQEEVEGDCDGWLHPAWGNRVRQMVESPDRDKIGGDMIRRIFL
ncbi:hypothetical protein H072_6781 [Dactylellina haptotyla CBS 200.50]|uniref:Inosine/uridine-preferring nucleoside hydrolase domain-containing protein n=1 Tax=Dactylellina haptotyla (strain CBS 200.50) TaxID=1284197 RepID=S8A8X0_DACHA|nr:hypothetical protein H072_6781 [Dactylellina haptotyla CBS 200.50]